MNNIAIFLLLITTLTGCVTTADRINSGNSAYAAGEYDKALKYWEPEAKKGHPVAQYNMGQWIRKVEKNEKKALEWYQLAANQGHSDSIYMIGLYYETGTIVKKNVQIAINYFTISARKGYPLAQQRLAQMNQPIPPVDLVTAPASKTNDLLPLYFLNSFMQGYNQNAVPQQRLRTNCVTRSSPSGNVYTDCR